MVERIGNGNALAREALLAALRSSGERTAETRAAPSAAGSSEALQGTDFARALEQGVNQVDETVRSAELLPTALMTGKVSDFHEIAIQLKSAELSFRFAMEIRNKLIDAYREVMRMSV